MAWMRPVDPAIGHVAVLDDPRRRYVVSQLLVRKTTDVDALTTELVAQEGTAPEESLRAARERVAISLVHDHLPRLDDHGVVEYDQQSGDVTLVSNAAELRPHLKDAATSAP